MTLRGIALSIFLAALLCGQADASKGESEKSAAGAVSHKTKHSVKLQEKKASRRPENKKMPKAKRKTMSDVESKHAAEAAVVAHKSRPALGASKKRERRNLAPQEPGGATDRKSKKGASTGVSDSRDGITSASTKSAQKPLKVAASAGGISMAHGVDNVDVERRMASGVKKKNPPHVCTAPSDGKGPAELFQSSAQAANGSKGLARSAETPAKTAEAARVAQDVPATNSVVGRTAGESGVYEPTRKRLDLSRFKSLAEERAKLATPATPLCDRIVKIVVDPGHGGHDPGAIGGLGTKEKDVVLEIGLKLAEKLRADDRFEVLMTRKDDRFIPLPDRTTFANKAHADLFVSVHANASPDIATSGIETFYLDLAKTARAAGLAAKENGMSLENVSVLQAVMFDLMVNSNVKDSSLLATSVQKSLVSKIRSRYEVVSHGVKQAPFYVLVGAQMPSVLVEVAFLSNQKEEGRLNTPEYIDDTAEGIYNGIVKYIKDKKNACQNDTALSKK